MYLLALPAILYISRRSRTAVTSGILDTPGAIRQTGSPIRMLSEIPAAAAG